MRFFAILFMCLILFSASTADARDSSGISTTDISQHWDQLGPVEQAEMAALLAKKAAEATTPAVPVVQAEQVEPWLQLIDKLGEGLVKLARDLGVTANELLVSPVGMITVALVAYHVMGSDMVSFFNAMIWACIIVPLLTVFFFKSVIPVIEYKELTKRNMFGKEIQVIKKIRRRPVFGGSEDFNVDWTFIVASAICFLAFIILLP